MALINYTSPNVNNTATSDAIKHFGQIGASGIFKIENATLSSTNSSGTITFSKGYVSIQGRFLEMEQGTTFNVSLTGGAYGYVCIKYDWQLQEATIINVEATDDYPTLTQSNMIATNDGEYYLPICKYTKTSTSLTLIDLEDEYYIEAYVDRLKSLEARVDAMGFEKLVFDVSSPFTIEDDIEYFKFGKYVLFNFYITLPFGTSITANTKYSMGKFAENYVPDSTIYVASSTVSYGEFYPGIGFSQTTGTKTLTDNELFISFGHTFTSGTTLNTTYDTGFKISGFMEIA